MGFYCGNFSCVCVYVHVCVDGWVGVDVSACMHARACVCVSTYSMCVPNPTRLACLFPFSRRPFLHPSCLSAIPSHPLSLSLSRSHSLSLAPTSPASSARDTRGGGRSPIDFSAKSPLAPCVSQAVCSALSCGWERWSTHVRCDRDTTSGFPLTFLLGNEVRWTASGIAVSDCGKCYVYLFI